MSRLYPPPMVDYLTSSLATLLVVADPILLSALFLAALAVQFMIDGVLTSVRT